MTNLFNCTSINHTFVWWGVVGWWVDVRHPIFCQNFEPDFGCSFSYPPSFAIFVPCRPPYNFYVWILATHQFSNSWMVENFVPSVLCTRIGTTSAKENRFLMRGKSKRFVRFNDFSQPIKIKSCFDLMATQNFALLYLSFLHTEHISHQLFPCHLFPFPSQEGFHKKGRYQTE